MTFDFVKRVVGQVGCDDVRFFELWESTGVFFSENVDKNLILRRFGKGVFSERIRHTSS